MSDNIDNLVADVDKTLAEAESIIAETNSKSFMSMKWLKMALMILLGILVVVFLIVTFTPWGHHLWKKAEHKAKREIVHELIERKRVLASQLSDDAPRYEFFFADSCGSCKRFKPVLYDYVIKHSKRSFRFIEHDCARQDLPENADCANYATIPQFIYRATATATPVVYAGAYTVQAIADFVRTNSGDNDSSTN